MSNFKLETYKLVKDEVKVAHIFSNNKFLDGSIRDGNIFDVKALTNTLPKLGFIVKLHKDLKQTKCFKELEKIADDDGKKASMILVIFLSHGSLNQINMIDNKTITIKQIIESFNSKVNSLAGKPKIFLFQMCQGIQSAKPVKVDEIKDSVPINEPGKITTKQTLNDEIIIEEVEDSTSSIPSGSDMFMGFASSPGFVSYRSPKNGSRFIQTFTTIINDEIHSRTRTEKIDFVSLMTKVAAEVADMSGGSWSNRLDAKAKGKPIPKETEKDIRMQMPWYSSTLRKKLEFEIPSEIPALKQNDDEVADMRGKIRPSRRAAKAENKLVPKKKRRN